MGELNNRFLNDCCIFYSLSEFKKNVIIIVEFMLISDN